MIIAATVINEGAQHRTLLRTGDKEHYLAISAKPEGSGSSVNGGELLFLALATCYCNDIYREAKERGIAVERVTVEVIGEFGGKGEPARNIRYRASIKANGTDEQLQDLMRYTDTVAEIQNTLRQASSVTLDGIEVIKP